MAMSALKHRINEDVKAAMRGKEKQRLAALRLITAAIKQKEVDERIELDDAQTTGVLDKMAKQRRESIAQYEKAQRADLVARERFELELIASYLPQPLAATEIQSLIDGAIAATGAASMKDMGKVMGQLKGQMQGRADLGKVSGMVKARLS